MRGSAVALLALALVTGCKRRLASDDAAPYVVGPEKSETEEQNLLALCQAAAQVVEEGVPDRTTRLGELALPMSADASLLDGLRATEPPNRMGVVRALIKKYDQMAACQLGLPAFEKGPPRPEELPPVEALPQPPGAPIAPPGGNPGPHQSVAPPAPPAKAGAPLPPR